MSQTTSEAESRLDQPKLLPALGMFSATMLVAGGGIGSGIFRKPGGMAAQVGSPELLLGVWLLAGLISLLGTLSNAELAAMMPQTGGQYVFLQRAYGSFVAFLYGWALFAVIQSGSIAALSYVFAEYATPFIALPQAPGSLAAFSLHVPFIGDIAPFHDLGVKGLGAGVILALTLINYLGVRFGGIVQNVFSIAKMAAMIGLAVTVAVAPGVGQWESLHHEQCDPSVRASLVGGSGSGVARGVLGLRRLAQNHVYRRRTQVAATRLAAQLDPGHRARGGALCADERGLCLRAAD